MPLSGPQSPGFYLPQAEYFALAPNATIALSGRRYRNFQQVATVPAGSTLNLQEANPIETTFNATSGIYIHSFNLIITMQDNSQEVQITGSLATLVFPPVAGAGIPLGIPLLTGVQPGGAYVALSDRELLYTGNDISASTGNPAGGTLNLALTLFLTNKDTTNPHNVSAAMQICYTRLEGLQT